MNASHAIPYAARTWFLKICGIILCVRSVREQMEQRTLGDLLWAWAVNSPTLSCRFQVHFCLEQGEGSYDLWRALCFRNSSETNKLLHLSHILLPFASFILRCFWKFFALRCLEAPANWCLRAGLRSVWVLGLAADGLHLLDRLGFSVASSLPVHFPALHQQLPADGAVSKCVCLGVIYTSPWRL